MANTSKHEVYQKSKIIMVLKAENLNLNETEDLHLLKVQDKLYHIPRDIEYEIVNSLLIYIRSLVIRKRVKDIQLGDESYQHKLNLTKPNLTFPGINEEEPYTMLQKPFGVVYIGGSGGNQFMAYKEVYKFCDTTLKKVNDELSIMMKDHKLGYKQG
ncbi:hypothetical protein Tco_0039959 [Tanacetum coccineum]